MDYKEHIEKAVQYIEQNLKYDIDLSACARVCGYSDYHFLRIFKEVTGLTPADYIRKRRLTEIAKQINDDDTYISEIAFSYGFNSKENFIRAFKSEHHILPTEYKSAQNSLKLYEAQEFGIKPFSVIPQIITLESFILTVYKSDEEYTPNFWNKYNAKKMSVKLSGGKTVKDYGVCIWNSSDSKLDYFIGIKKEDAKGDISGTRELTVPGGLYAVFSTPITTQSEFVNNIHKTWSYISNVWFRDSGYIRTGGCEFECYIEESRIFSEDIYIPLEMK